MKRFKTYLKEARIPKERKEKLDFDLIIVGGGPAGLTAAINGASEALSVCIIDSANKLGGQARDSKAIENYPGFPHGISGDSLLNNFVNQAEKFNSHIATNTSAMKITRKKDGKIEIETDDHRKFTAKSAILSNGLAYRKLPSLEGFEHRGVYYGMPEESLPGGDTSGTPRNIVVVGGGNSSGQAALYLASLPNTQVHVIVRSNMAEQMSHYLVERINKAPNIHVLEGTEVVKGEADNSNPVPLGAPPPFLKRITLSNGMSIETDKVYVFIGSSPRTAWCKGSLDLDERGFIKTGKDLDGNRLPYETSMRGVFAVGDVRSGSTKRMSAAVGEGARALQMCHVFLAQKGTVVDKPNYDQRKYKIVFSDKKTGDKRQVVTPGPSLMKTVGGFKQRYGARYNVHNYSWVRESKEEDEINREREARWAENLHYSAKVRKLHFGGSDHDSITFRSKTKKHVKNFADHHASQGEDVKVSRDLVNNWHTVTVKRKKRNVREEFDYDNMKHPVNKLRYNKAYNHVAKKRKWKNRDFDIDFDNEVGSHYNKLVKKVKPLRIKRK